MNSLLTSIYEAGYDIWNTLIDIAINLIKTSPTSAGGGQLYAIVHQVFNVLSTATMPVLILFFMISILKNISQTPPERLASVFFQDAIRYCIIIVMASQAWKITGYIFQFTDGITDSVAGTIPKLELSDTMRNVINSVSDFNINFDDGIGNGIKEWFNSAMLCIVFLIGALITLGVMAACAFSIISAAYKRIIQPLIILPFSGLAIARAAGGADQARETAKFFSYFFSLCINGTIILIIIRLGMVLSSTIVFPTGGNEVKQIIFSSLQNFTAPIIISGLIKSVDSIASRIF